MTKYTTDLAPVTVNVRTAFPAKTFGQKTVYIPFATLPEAVIAQLLEQGAMRILNDGNGKADMTDDERYAKMQKRVDAWMAGSFRVIDRGDAIGNLAKECYIKEQMAKHPGTSQEQIKTAMRDKVKANCGDVNATFDNFIKAVAKEMVKAGDKRPVDEIENAAWTKYEALAKDLAAERANAGKGLDLSIDF